MSTSADSVTRLTELSHLTHSSPAGRGLVKIIAATLYRHQPYASASLSASPNDHNPTPRLSIYRSGFIVVLLAGSGATFHHYAHHSDCGGKEELTSYSTGHVFSCHFGATIKENKLHRFPRFCPLSDACALLERFACTSHRMDPRRSFPMNHEPAS